MKKILILIMALFATSAFATAPAPVIAPATITSVMNGTISVGTMVSAAPAQSITQTSIGTLTGASSVSNLATSPVISASIVGTASSTVTGNGYVSPTWSIVDYSGTQQNVSAMSSGTVVTTVSNLIVPVIVTGSSSHD